MASITFKDGRRVEYNNYSEFSTALEALKYAGVKYINYYSKDGEPHVVCYEIAPDGKALVLGESVGLSETEDYMAAREVGMHVSMCRFDEFCGFSI